jgi:hypothetical protein
MCDTPETAALTRVADCAVGMRVRHVSHTGRSQGAGEGTIVSIGTDGVHVDYDNHGTHGIYDDDWFRRYHSVLVRICSYV